jgi:hypothetical protein
VNGTAEQRPEERLDSEEISEDQREECETPSTGRMAQNPATAPTHQTRSDEKLHKSHGPDSIAIQVLAEKFPQLREAKIEEGVFVGHQIRKFFRDDMFNNLLQGDEKKAWDAFHLVSANFLRSIRTENYKELIEDILSLYHKLGCNMSLKIHMLHSYLYFFPDNCGMVSDEHCGMVSDEHGERFHREIATMEKGYQGKWSTSMLAEYCWTLTRNAPEQLHERQAKRSHR